MFTEGDVTYHCAEQYLMARKAALFGDEATRQAMLAARTPGECKALGHRVSPYDDACWAEERFGVALDMLRLKFGQNARLRAALLGTGESELVEAAPDDRIWGVEFSEQDAPGAQQAWGENLLGRALVALRAELTSDDGSLKVGSG
ncbi:NADAR family protein [Deinococcus kurensis]|uniref:NADAR family protein n=1 Tax=Deinococcus kurensis TaxID=2662757 RepID=UPI001391DAA5|nr:NADAR family protein [Deinococcus kurensis]